jgi:hypothetical protein
MRNYHHASERIEPPQAFANPVPTGERLAHHISLRSTWLRPVVLRQVAPPFGLANMLDSHPAHQPSLAHAFITRATVGFAEGTEA